MEKETVIKMTDYDMAKEEIVNFIDNLIVNKISEKIMEEVKKREKSITEIKEDLKTLSSTSKDIEDQTKKSDSILNLLLKDSKDLDILDDDPYIDFDIAEHSEQVEKELAKLVNREIYDSKLLFNQITNENDRIKNELIKVILEKLSTESSNQQDKVHRITKILLNQEKNDAAFSADEYLKFDIVEKTNALDRNIHNLIEHEKTFEEKITKILVKKDGETQPEYFESIEKEIKSCLENKKTELAVILNRIEEETVEESKVIRKRLDECESKSDRIAEDIKNLSEWLDDSHNNASVKVTSVEKQMKIMGVIVIIIQIMTMIVAYLN